jgi:hypothetical protein
LIFCLVSSQALSYSQGSKTRYLVRLQLHEPASSSLPTLLQLKEGKAAGTASLPAGSIGGIQDVPADGPNAMPQLGFAVEHGAPAVNRRSSE